MKNFLFKHILFPKRFGWIPYSFLIFLLPNFLSLVVVSDVEIQIIGFILLFIFLKVYRNNYYPPYKISNIVLQLLIASFFLLNPWIDAFWLHSFIGLGIGFLDISDQRFRRYLIFFYSCTIPIYLFATLIFWNSFIDKPSFIWTAVPFAFSFISPIFSKTFNQNYKLYASN